MTERFYITRRSFLSKCTATAAATGLPLWMIKSELAAAQEVTPAPRSANDQPGIALIGCGSQGSGDASAARRHGNIVAVCDVDQGHVDRAASRLGANGKAPDKFTDFRKVLDRSDVQIIVMATPDHWHTHINMAAARAKKDIYGEKPLTLTVDEGRRVIKAVRDNKVVFQTGTQQRSSQRFHKACELVRNGRIGKLKQVEVFVPAGLRAGPFQTAPVPEGFNFDYWLGQAPQVEYMKERCFSTFRWWWDYAGGPVTDWGAHHNDIARWAIGQDGPQAIEAKVITGPIPGGYTTPSEYEATLTWANGVTQIIKTTLDDDPFGTILKKDGQRNGIKFIGADGWIWVNRADLSASNDDILNTPLPDNAIHLEVSGDHMGNFFDCVRSRKDPISKVEDGHCSAVIGHLIIIALRTGKKLDWDPAKEQFTGEGAKEASAYLAREMRKPYDYTFAG
ncbi:MAG: Gfo/Idh/MocA family oxidoreductase [Verrucomicrobiota bacterium]|jgi:predicted dehydrogenase